MMPLPQVLGRHSSFMESVSFLVAEFAPLILIVRLALRGPPVLCFSGTMIGNSALQ